MIEISEVMSSCRCSVIEMSGSAVNTQISGISRAHPRGVGMMHPPMQNPGMSIPSVRSSRSHLTSSSFTWIVLSARRSTLPPSRRIFTSYPAVNGPRSRLSASSNTNFSTTLANSFRNACSDAATFRCGMASSPRDR